MSGEFAGRLRERVRIEHRANGRDAIGGSNAGFTYDGEAWAAVMPLIPADLTQAGTLSALPRWRVTMRKREGLSLSTRLTWRGRHLAVRALLSDPSEPAQLMLTCEELR